MSTLVWVLLRRPHVAWVPGAMAAVFAVAVLIASPSTGVAVVVGMVLACAGAVPVLGRTLSRRQRDALTELSAAAAGADLDRPEWRLPIPDDPQLRRLAHSLNDLLRRLQEGAVRHRHCLDDTAHDLRTPLAIIRGALELSGDNPESVRALALAEVHRMDDIINHLLVLTRAQQHDGLDLTDVNVPALLADVVARARLLADRDWQCEQVAAACVRADRAYLIRALLQLASNAAAHTQDGDVIEIGADVGSGRVRMWVHDSGPGVDYDDARSIFERGKVSSDGATATAGRPEHPRHRRGEDGHGAGLGLGLAIVRSIAHAHDGEVYLEEGRPGPGGARFVLDLPAAQPQALDPALEPPALEPAAYSQDARARRPARRWLLRSVYPRRRARRTTAAPARGVATR